MDKKNYDKAYKRLVQRITIISLLLLTIFFLKQFVTQYQINQEINTSYIINISGRQRMLSQKIVKDISFIHREEPNLKEEVYIKELEESLELWKGSHKELLELNQRKGFLEKENLNIIQKFLDIEPSFQEMVYGAEAFLKEIKNRKIDKNQLDLYANKVIDNEVDFLKKMDSIVCLYEEEATKSIKSMKATHMVLFILIIVIFVFMVVKILVPLLRYVDKAFWKVTDTNKNLTNMFHTMKGALFVFKRDGNIVSMNRDAEKIVLRDNNVSEKLYMDEDIKWIDFDIGNLIDKVRSNDTRIEDVETRIKDKDGNLVAATISAFSGNYEGDEVIVLNLIDVTAQKKAEEILKNTAYKDELTGLYNRHFLESIIKGEIQRAQRYDIPISAALLDLDFFKKVNDKWGHPVGDTVLKLTAETILKNIRKSDFAIRIGGEEFLILMPNTDSKGALANAEKIRKAVEKLKHPIVGSFTASLGVAERLDGEKYQFLYERVDQALYQAKENGRNRIELAESQSCEYDTVLFQWNDKWNCGEKKIDQQHKELFQVVSRLIEDYKDTDDKETSVKNLKEIINAVAEHFDYEEQVLMSLNYKDFYKHKKIHSQLIIRSKEIMNDVDKEKLDGKKALNLIFDEVIVGHLLCEDIKFYPLIDSLE